MEKSKSELYQVECEILKLYYKSDAYRDKLKKKSTPMALEEMERKSYYMMGLRDALDILMRIANKNNANLSESKDFEQFIKEKYKNEI